MTRVVTRALGLAITLGVAGCMTDVSRSVDFGTQGAVMTGLATGTRGIAAGRDGVFFTTNGSIEFCPGDGVWEGFYYGGNMGRIVTDDQNVYWTELVEGRATGGRVLYCPQAGCAGAPVVVADQLGVTYGTDLGQLDLGFLAVDGQQIYWTTKDPATTTVTLDSCAFASCPAPVAVPLATEMTPVAVHDGTLYAWSARVSGTALVTCPATSPSKGQPTCTQPATLVPETFDVGLTVIDGDQLYFVSNATPGVWACTLPLCSGISEFIYGPADALASRNGSIYVSAAGRFNTCLVGSSCPWAEQEVDLPFVPTIFPQVNPPPNIVAGPGGAYAYATYLEDANFAAIVYLPAPAGGQ